jgi:hypothetical protein
LYDTDVKVALWECSEGKHLDEFAKLLSDNPKEAAADLRRLMKDSKAIRGIVLRILRKTITDLPDITDAVRDQRAQDNNKITLIHDEPVVNSEESLFDTIPSPEGNTTEERLEQLEQIAEWRNKTKMFTTRELKLYQNELSRLKAGKTREEFYDTPKSVTQQLKYMRHKYST